MSLLDSLETKTGYTANWAVTNLSTLNDCLDLFFICWASRRMWTDSIINMWIKAYNEDANTALKILFYARDCRGWQGERRFFRTIWNYINKTSPSIVTMLNKYVPEYWRWDDIIGTQEDLYLFAEAINNWDRLASKWMPRNSKFSNMLAKFMWLTNKQLRQLVVKNTEVVETLMSKKDYSSVNYSTVPSVAMKRYKSAFERNDPKWFEKFVAWLSTGKTKINSSVLYPSDVYNSFLRDRKQSPDLINAQWYWLAQYGWDDSILPVIDTSGSMNGLPLSISVSLWLYLSQNIKGKFQDCMITFEYHPKLVKLAWTPYDRLVQTSNIRSDCWTNIQWVFDLMLSVAIRDWLTQDDMPEKIIIISDMEFNSCGSRHTNFDVIKAKFEASWYKLPYLIFWNVNGREWNNPAQSQEYVWLVSWSSPSVLNSIVWWTFKTPMDLMYDVISSERYENIHI